MDGCQQEAARSMTDCIERLEGKTIEKVIDESSPKRAADEYYTVTIIFTDGTRLTLNSGSQYCDDTWIEVEIESLQ